MWWVIWALLLSQGVELISIHIVGPSQWTAHRSRAQYLCSVLLVRAVHLGDAILHLVESVLCLQKHPDDNSLSL